MWRYVWGTIMQQKFIYFLQREENLDKISIIEKQNIKNFCGYMALYNGRKMLQ